MPSSGVFELVAYTDLAAADCFAAVDVSDTTQAAQGSLKKITATAVFAAAREITIASGTVTVSTPVLQATQTWNAGGVTFTAIDLNVTATASAAASLLINLRVAAASMFKVDKTGAATFAAGVTATTGDFNGNVTMTSGSFTVTAAGSIIWTGRARMASPGDGVITLQNNAASDFTRLQFGGTTSAFPSWKRSGTTLVARLADDSAPALVSCAAFDATTAAFSGLLSANAGATVASGQTLTVTGATITGLTAASVGAGTYPAGAHVFAGALSGITTLAMGGALSGVTTLACGAITSTGQILVTNTSSNQAQIRYDGSNYFNVNVSSAGAVNIQAVGGSTPALSLDGKVVMGAGASAIAFYGGTATTKATVTGSRGGNAALASLLTLLATFGLLTDSSS